MNLSPVCSVAGTAAPVDVIVMMMLAGWPAVTRLGLTLKTTLLFDWAHARGVGKRAAASASSTEKSVSFVRIVFSPILDFFRIWLRRRRSLGRPTHVVRRRLPRPVSPLLGTCRERFHR